MWIIPPFPIKHQKDDDDDDDDDGGGGGGGDDDDDDSLEVWSNVRVGGNKFYCLHGATEPSSQDGEPNGGVGRFERELKRSWDAEF